ncbi:hypothetical protein THAOC_33631 [Thalassiosira oceanica]|uniref:Uncharacterized protein n=1 Tax=Thalassiosira oceanica TaxID=159749 RepID=K0R6S1_THAOC|nr:hypothetical protein THAOC_33631 [Thalassiosira oceanica]|eukprot:EJK47634.1 hypothetical protein THAOC_33631 [Thalassiosira oceanica]
MEEISPAPSQQRASARRSLISTSIPPTHTFDSFSSASCSPPPGVFSEVRTPPLLVAGIGVVAKVGNMVRALAFLPVAAAVLSISFVAPSAAFMPTPSGVSVSAHGPNGSGAGETTNSIRNCKTRISAADDGSSTETKAAPQVTGEELELMLQEWDTPLVVDAYATW